MKRPLFLFLVVILTIITNFSFATIVTSNGTGGGDWDDASTWDPSGVPGCVDTISILAGDVVEITAHQDYEECDPIVLLISGELSFPNNGTKLRLPCESTVVGIEGGLISAPGHDNSNKIFICEEWVWMSGDGEGEDDENDLFGPFELSFDALPVELMHFEAEIDNTTVKLTWKTAAEINNDYFTIERSLNGTTFEKLENIPGSGNSSTIKEYEYYDDNPIEGTSYYRLKQTDFDEKYEYIKLIAINYNLNEDGSCTLKVYPNPCVGVCTVDLLDCPLHENTVNVELYDAFGKKISNKISQQNNNDKNISFHLNTSNNLSPGVYIVKAATNNKKQSQKVIVK